MAKVGVKLFLTERNNRLSLNWRYVFLKNEFMYYSTSVASIYLPFSADIKDVVLGQLCFAHEVFTFSELPLNKTCKDSLLVVSKFLVLQIMVDVVLPLSSSFQCK